VKKETTNMKYYIVVTLNGEQPHQVCSDTDGNDFFKSLEKAQQHRMRLASRARRINAPWKYMVATIEAL
jgi:hypothetical protein